MDTPEIPAGPFSVEFLQAEVTSLKESLKKAIAMREESESTLDRYRYYIHALGNVLSGPRDYYDPQRVYSGAKECILDLQEHIKHIHETRPWPNIGPDPLKQRDLVDNSKEGWMRRISRPADIQQQIVPDQTALVWRADLNWAHMELIILKSRAESFENQNDQLKAAMKRVIDWIQGTPGGSVLLDTEFGHKLKNLIE